MDCVWCVNFYDLFDEYAEDGKFMELAFKMKAFERNSVIIIVYIFYRGSHLIGHLGVGILSRLFGSPD